MAKTIITVIGTRPEALKLVPLHRALLLKNPGSLLVATYQHKELLDQALDLFGIAPDIVCNLMAHDQTLAYLAGSVLSAIDRVIQEHCPDLVIVQGDTSTAYASALAAFYRKVPVAHVEAGLRSNNTADPFPEEAHRTMIRSLASYHFAPTPLNAAYLMREGVGPNKIFITGNTIIDTLYMVRKKQESSQKKSNIDHVMNHIVAQNKKIVLVTTHRRESFNQGLASIFDALKQFIDQHTDAHIIFPTHPNPHVQNALKASKLVDHSQITLLEPLAYEDLILCMSQCHMIVTDSGGIQEEASALNKPLVIVRNATERPEVLWSGQGILAGTEANNVLKCLNTTYHRGPLEILPSPFGDGTAHIKIAKIIQKILDNSDASVNPIQHVKGIASLATHFF